MSQGIAAPPGFALSAPPSMSRRESERMISPAAAPDLSENRRLKIAIVIPAKDEQASIGQVLAALPGSLPGVDLRIFVVDDGSTDATARIAAQAGAVVVRHAANRGIGAALTTGFQHARAWGPDIYIQMDSDGQHDPHLLRTLIEPILKDRAEFVIGTRARSDWCGLSPVRRVGIRIYSWTIGHLAHYDLTDMTSGFRAFRGDVYDRVAFQSERNWAVEMTLRAGLDHVRMIEVSTPHLPRLGGQSQFSAQRLFVIYHFRALKQFFRAYATRVRDPYAAPSFRQFWLANRADVATSYAPARDYAVGRSAYEPSRGSSAKPVLELSPRR
jgi:glycosyltransferase involved in cell wall biosynthesis